jgi:hypothetical protein
MKDQIQEGRRDFLKTSAAGAAGLMVGGVAVEKASASTGGAWTDGMQINPNIDNLRVACITDAKLANSNTYADDPTIDADMDKLAMCLAKKSTAAAAWATIFQKPASKTWAQVKVGLKVEYNTLAMTMFKCAKELNNLGVPYSNMYAFDCNTSGSSRCSGAAPSNMPAGMNWSGPAKGSNDLLGGLTATPVPYQNASVPLTMVNMNCCASVVNGTLDILVSAEYADHDHSNDFGGANLTCKNAYGIFNAVDSCCNPPYLHGNSTAAYDGITGTLGLQKSSAFLSNNNPPRMQLAIMNAFANGTNKLAMGVFCPIMDYLTYTRIRGPLWGKPTLAVWKRFYTDFGYTDAQCANLDFVDAATYTTEEEAPLPRMETSRVSVVLSSAAFDHASVDWDLPFYGTAHAIDVKIFDVRGGLVREFAPGLDRTMTVTWDGKSQNGERVPAGFYAVKVFADGKGTAAGRLACVPR